MKRFFQTYKMIVGMVIIVAVSITTVWAMESTISADRQEVEYMQQEKKKEERVHDKANASGFKKGFVADAQFFEVEPTPETLISMNAVSQNVLNKIEKRQDSDLIAGLRKITVDKKLDVQQQEILVGYVNQPVDTQVVYSLYEFLYENCFTIYDLDEALRRYQAGEAIESIFEDYFQKENSFIPYDYQEGELDFYRNTLHLTDDQIRLIEILEFRNVISRAQIVEHLQNGEDFTALCESIGLLNKQYEMEHISLSGAEVKACEALLGVSQDEAVKRIVQAKKAKVDTADVSGYLQSGKTYGEQLKQYYTERFAA